MPNLPIPSRDGALGSIGGLVATVGLVVAGWVGGLFDNDTTVKDFEVNSGGDVNISIYAPTPDELLCPPAWTESQRSALSLEGSTPIGYLACDRVIGPEDPDRAGSYSLTLYKDGQRRLMQTRGAYIGYIEDEARVAQIVRE